MVEQMTQSGGAMLRALRQRAGRTQLFVELEAELGSGYLQRVESGKVLQPEKPTLARILAALQVPYMERSAVFELFGYMIDRPLPTDAEMSWACSVSSAVLQEISLPAYLLDCAHRLLAWNLLIPQFISITSAELEAMRRSHLSLIEAWFTQSSTLHTLVHDPDTFYSQMIQALEHEMHPFQHEQWCKDLFTHWLHTLPLFRDYWLSRDQTPPPAVAARLLKSLSIKHSQAGLLQFRLAVEPLNPDTRFRIVYYIPADTKTESFLRSCSQSQGENIDGIQRLYL
ncbi:MAG: hypothetical protein H0U76_19735 [Ktedonobacteraceae bacterium]|nr:hypothetical protein [Ktedonobacteraceae bacterium]